MQENTGPASLPATIVGATTLPGTHAKRKGEVVGHVSTAEYGSQMLSLGGVHHITGGSKKEGRTTVDMANGPVSRITPIPETIALLEKLGAKNSHRCASCW